MDFAYKRGAVEMDIAMEGTGLYLAREGSFLQIA